MEFNKKQIDVRGGEPEQFVKHPKPPKFENPFLVKDSVRKALFPSTSAGNAAQQQKMPA